MWHQTQASALHSALARIGRPDVDADQLVIKARGEGLTLPVRCDHVSSPNLGRGVGLAYQVEHDRLDDLASIVTKLTGTRTPA